MSKRAVVHTSGRTVGHTVRFASPLTVLLAGAHIVQELGRVFGFDVEEMEAARVTVEPPPEGSDVFQFTVTTEDS